MRLTELHHALRQARVFQYPPALYDTIGKWVDQVIAGHFWYMAQDTIDTFVKPRLVDKETSLSYSLDYLELSFKEMVRNAKNDYVSAGPRSYKIEGFSYDMNLNGVYVDIPGKGQQIVKAGWLVCYPYDDRDDQGDRMYAVAFIPVQAGESLTSMEKFAERRQGKIGIPAREVEKYLRIAADKAEQAIRALAQRFAGSTTSVGEIKLVELTQLIQECKKYTSKPKGYASKAGAKFPVDLKGWSYLPDVLRGEDAKRYKRKLEEMERSLSDLVAAVKRLKPGQQTKPYRFYHPSGHETYYWVRTMRQVDKDLPVAGYILYEGKEDFAGQYTLPEDIEAFLRRAVIKLLTPPRAQSTLEEFLKSNRMDQVSVILFFKGHSKRGGQWNWAEREIQVDLKIEGGFNAKSLHACLYKAHTTLQHELQHLGQDYLAVLKGLIEDAGLPSKKIREKDVTPSGIPLITVQDGNKTKKVRVTEVKRKKGDLRIEHPLRDVEFYTDLNNAVRELAKLLEKIPAKDRRKIFDIYTAHTPGITTSQHFRTWKAKNPAKWQKAVSELLKALNDQGFAI